MEQVVESLGLEKERFEIVWCSSAEADRFVEAVTRMTETVRKLGPSPFNRAVLQAAAS
jgi:F420-non-reducing hydrogenase iron-sulfur subunit